MTLRMRVLPRFPAKITGTNGLTVDRPSGTPDLIVKPDFGSLVQIPSIGDGDNVFFMAWDRLLGLYRIMSFNDLFDGVSSLGFMATETYDPQNKSADAFARANHTGVQAISTVTDLQTALDAKLPLVDGVRYDAAQANTAARQAQARTNISAALSGHIYGLTLSNNATDATNNIDIAAGEAASTENNPVLMALSSTMTKRLDAAWAVGSGNGGLDTGSIANTTYHIWLIQRSDTGVVDALFSTSATSPTMPTNYDRKRRIGSIMRESAAIVPFSQSGDEFLLKSLTLDINVQNPGTSAVLRTLRVPLGLKVLSIAQYNAINLGSAVQGAFYVSSPDQNDQAPSVTGAAPLGDFGSVANLAGQQQSDSARMIIRTNTSGQVRTRNVASDSNVFINIVTVGWLDNRGKL